MPRRTNEFQELVSLVTKSFARPGDTVEDSAMVKVLGSEQEREIDILYQTSTGLVTVKIAVEAKDEGRPLDVTALEQLLAKYRGEGRVPVDKFYVVSRNGFTEGARDKARMADVPLMTLDEAKGADWASICPTCPGDQGAGTARFQIAPHFHEVRLVPPLPPSLAAAILREGRVLCGRCADGHDHGTLLTFAWARTLGRCDAAGDHVRAKLAEGLKQHPNGALLSIRPPLCLGYRVRHAGVEYPMNELHVTVHARDCTATVRCTPLLWNSSHGPDRAFPHFRADFGDVQMDWVMPHGMRSPSITLNIKSKQQPSRKERRKQESIRRRAARSAG